MQKEQNINDLPLAIIPEYVVFDTVNFAIKWIRSNYEGKENKDLSYISSLFKGWKRERYDLLKELKAIVLADIDDPKLVQVNMMLNRHRELLPTIHITVPGETYGQNAMMNSQEYAGLLDDEEEEEYQEIYTRRFKSTYNIIITSANSNEVAALYHLLKHLLISLLPYMNHRGLENITIGGADLQAYSEIFPQAYVKGISLGVEYMTNAPSVDLLKYIKSIEYEGKPINKDH